MPLIIPETPTKILDLYDFAFANGHFMPIVIDETLGDSIDIGPSIIFIHAEGRNSPIDASRKLLSEDITINRAHLQYMQHRVVEVADITVELDQDWVKQLTQKATVQ